MTAMILLAILGWAIVVALCGVIVVVCRYNANAETRITEIFAAESDKSLMRHLEFANKQQAEIRALTHSLCMAEGKPYIMPVGERKLDPASPSAFATHPGDIPKTKIAVKDSREVTP